MNTSAKSPFSISICEYGVATCIIDTPGTRFNILSKDIFVQLEEELKKLSEQCGVRSLLILSGKEDSFIAGADIKDINSVETQAEAYEISRGAQKVFDALDQLPFPTLSAIHGVCLGGGTELILATDYRLISDSPKSMIGLPEVQLGIIPGAGGTQRLPKLVGLDQALPIILTGSNVRAKKAKRIGLVDEVVPTPILKERAYQAAKELAGGGGMAHKNLKNRELSLSSQIAGLPGVRSVAYSQAKAELREKTKGLYPAPFQALEAVRYSNRTSLDVGQEKEAEFFSIAASSPVRKSLMHLFHATTSLKGDNGIFSNATPAPVNHIGVLGGGLMGSGIATVLADKGFPVSVKDISLENLGKTLGYANKVYQKKVKKKIYRPYDAELRVTRIQPTVEYQDLKQADIVIEAVFEDIQLKHQVLQDVEALGNEKLIFASNTSSLPIGDIAKGASRPENVIGMHFFSPVEKMKLVEVITTPQTADWVTATTVELARKMGNHVIVVGDGAGFFTSRVLASFCNEAIRVLYDGAPIDSIDKAMASYGFPVGPLILMDEVGIGVVSKVMKIMTQAFPERFYAPEGWEKLIEGREGKRNQKGFYLYQDGGKEPDTSLYRLIPNGGTNPISPQDIQERLLYAFLNESALCLEEKILLSPRDGDIGSIFGLGFPPYLGGPFFAMDQIGISTVVDNLKRLESSHGAQFKPAQILTSMAEEEMTFFQPGE